MIVRHAIAASLALLAITAPAAAQQYPTKPIRMVVPFPPGGFSDTFARVIGNEMNKSWGQQVIVDNRTVAGGVIGSEIVAKAPPDGYTLVMGTIGTHAINATLFPKLSYDPIKDFTAVAFVVEAEGLLVVHPSLPVKTTKDLIAFARQKPGELTFASAGAGSTSHLAGELFKTMAKVNVLHIPYKGNAPAITEMLSGQTSMLFGTLPTVLPQVQANRLRAVAVLGAKRSPALPSIPTIGESALPGFEVTNWTGILAPAGTPAAIVSRLNAETNRVMALPEVQARLPKEGLRHVAMTPQQFAEFVRSELNKWGPIVKATGAKAE